LTPIASLEREPDIEIEFFCDEPGRDIPPGLDRFEVAEGGRCYTAEDAYYLEFDNSLMRLRQGAPVRVEVWIRQVPETVDAEVARVTSFAVCAALRRFGLFELHSGAVVEPDSDRGVLIVGPSGSGKSTLTYQLANAGWPYLSDDEVLLSVTEAGDQIEARGFRSFFALRDSAGVDFKNVFEPAGVFSSTRASSVVPGYLLFTAISGDKQTQLRELSQTETMTRLIRACPWATYDTAIAGANLELLSRLARQATGFDLAAGTDLLEPGRAAELLSPFLRQN
ncbi:MAG TPA: hypothetical protein VFZ22_22795, partial [Pyrinomonadaceae bacterium]|nr:hypothetical protein [Pyrinomonadaceae bacterium]